MSQHQFQSFILKRTKPEYQVQVANLLMQGFLRLNTQGLDKSYLLQWQQQLLPLIMDKDVKEVKQAIASMIESIS